MLSKKQWFQNHAEWVRCGLVRVQVFVCVELSDA
jgi:hypothetical protein